MAQLTLRTTAKLARQSPRVTATAPAHLRVLALQGEKPLQGEAHALQLESSPAHCN